MSHRNKDKYNEYQRKWRLANRAKLNEYNERWRKEHIEQSRKIRKKTYEKNKEKIKAYRNSRKEEHRKYCRWWNTTAKGKSCAARFHHTRRALKLNQLGPNPPTTEQIKEMMAKPCRYCGNPSEHIDHFYPLSKGGLHDISNLVPACAPCNLSKGNKDPHEFLNQINLPKVK